MKPISLFGKKWRVHKQTANRLTLVLDESPLAAWRKKQKLNQRDAASHLGISQTYLAKIELGDRNCPPELLEKIHA